MVLVAASITKSVPFMGVGEEFSNVYHYDVATADAPTAEAIIAALTTAERRIHAGIVTFKQGRVWTAGGLPIDNKTVAIVDLTGPGEHYTDPNMYRECVWQVGWVTERPSITGRPVHLRKFLHTQSQFASIPVEDVTNGQAPLPTAARTALTTYMSEVESLVTTAGTFGLTAPSGRVVKAGAVNDYYLEHRQFHTH